MHRHVYQGRKLSRPLGQRQALLKGLLTSLVLYEQISTTEAKAKEIVANFDQLVTAGKKATLAARRQLYATLLTENAVRKLMIELVPAWGDRSSGYTSLIKSAPRRGDNAPMAVVKLILPDRPSKPAGAELDQPAATKPRPAKTPAKAKAAPKAKKASTK